MQPKDFVFYFINKRNPKKFLSGEQQWPGPNIRGKTWVQRVG